MLIGAIIQARMGSTRLPRKVLMTIQGKPLICHDLDQVSKSRLIKKIIVATTTEKKDDVLAEEVEKYGYDVFRGSENDVLDRYYWCAKKFGIDVIVRVTADCPLIDPEVVDTVISRFLEEPDCAYCSNVQPPTYPDGLDVEVMPFSAVERAWKEAKLASEREHVTPYIWKNASRFNVVNVTNDKDLNWFRLTVDEKEDFILVEKIYEKIKQRPILLHDVMELFRKEPDLLMINSKFQRNEGYVKSLREDNVVI